MVERGLIVFNMYHNLVINADKHKFLFEELVKRDFKKKYKRTVLGFIWSMLSPLIMLGVLSFVFSHFFGKTIEYYGLYILAGQVVFSYFAEATNSGMNALYTNSNIFSKINLPKYLFVLSRSLTAGINFLFTLMIFFVFVFSYGIDLHISMLLIIYPIICLSIFNFGIGLFLSVIYVFFRDMQYLYSLLLQLFMYGSAIFYSIDILPSTMRYIFFFNPIYVYISYIRESVIYNSIPNLTLTILCLFYAGIALILGVFLYRKYNYKFIYYI